MIGIIGGTGFTRLVGTEVSEQQWFDTPFGETSAPVCFCEIAGRRVAFLARHGDPHNIPPHLINYRANLYALKMAGVSSIIALNAVGGIHEQLGPSELAIPNQVIDYTYGREHTIYDGVHSAHLDHIDFTSPYDETLRAGLLSAARELNFPVLDGGVYGATQGPRLESAAEIKRYKSDGCDMVGMTGMPEASLARELDLAYACVALSANWAAGIGEATITMDDIREAVASAVDKVQALLKCYLAHG